MCACCTDIAASPVCCLIFVDAARASTEHTHASLLWSPNPEALDSKGNSFMLSLLSSSSSLFIDVIKFKKTNKFKIDVLEAN